MSEIISLKTDESFPLDVVRIKLVKDAPLYSQIPLNSPYEAAAIIGKSLCELDREAICVINLQADLKPINVSVVSVGTLNAALTHPREILKASILSNAASMMLVHNHTSGTLIPSEQDSILTDRMNQICSLVGIDLLDHLIVGGNNKEFFSFKEKGLIDNPCISYHSDYREISFTNNLVAERVFY